MIIGIIKSNRLTKKFLTRSPLLGIHSSENDHYINGNCTLSSRIVNTFRKMCVVSGSH